MTFTVVVCVKDPGDLEQALTPFNAHRKVAPWRDYVPGPPAGFWTVPELRDHGLLDPDDATLTWAQVAAAHNERYPGMGLLQVGGDGRAYTVSTSNPDGRWKWWETRGRRDGWFPVRPGRAREVLQPRPGPDGALRCDGGPVGALDLGAIRDEAEARARAACALWEELTAGTPEALPWRVFAAKVSAGGCRDEDAVLEYHAQPRVQAVRAVEFFSFRDDPVAEFTVPEAVHVARARAGAVVGGAVVTLDGRWLAPAGPGTEDGPAAYLDGLHGDVYLIAVDCHD
jgi:hypothetical protein